METTLNVVVKINYYKVKKWEIYGKAKSETIRYKIVGPIVKNTGRISNFREHQ
jgi:hypothetical protein